MPSEHSMSCEFPEGCSCGASVFNALEKQANELERRVTNQRSHIEAFARCLDGLMTPEQQAAIPGSGIDGARDANQIRTVVAYLSTLVAVTAEERDRCARRAAEARDMLVRADSALETCRVSKMSPVRVNIASTLNQ